MCQYLSLLFCISNIYLAGYFVINQLGSRPSAGYTARLGGQPAFGRQPGYSLQVTAPWRATLYNQIYFILVGNETLACNSSMQPSNYNSLGHLPMIFLSSKINNTTNTLNELCDSGTSFVVNFQLLLFFFQCIIFFQVA